MKIQTFLEAKQMFKKYVSFKSNGFGREYEENYTDVPIILIGNGSGRSYLIDNEPLVKKNGWKLIEFKNDYYFIDKLKQNKRVITKVENMKNLKHLFIKNIDMNIIDMTNLYCGLPKEMFEKKFVKAFNCEIEDFSIGGQSIQEYRRGLNL